MELQKTFFLVSISFIQTAVAQKQQITKHILFTACTTLQNALMWHTSTCSALGAPSKISSTPKANPKRKPYA